MSPCNAKLITSYPSPYNEGKRNIKTPSIVTPTINLARFVLSLAYCFPCHK